MKVGATRGYSRFLMTIWAIRSDIVGVPNGLNLPFDLGISTRRTGGGK